jgi:ArsR family transcriptional regulator, nickel/cobalt-responsive transcriptional repressor
MTDPKQAKLVAELLGALAEPNRLRIVECLRTGSKNVTELAKLLTSEIVNISHHLGVLRQAGLVVDVKDGRFVNYSLHPAVFNNENPQATFMDLGWCRIEIPNI